MFYNRHQYVLFNPKKKCGCLEVKSKVWASRTSGFEPRTFHGNSVDVLPLSYPHLHVFWSSNQSCCDNLLFRFDRKDEKWVSSIFEAGSSSWIVLSLCFLLCPNIWGSNKAVVFSFFCYFVFAAKVWVWWWRPEWVRKDWHLGWQLFYAPVKTKSEQLQTYPIIIMIL